MNGILIGDLSKNDFSAYLKAMTNRFAGAPTLDKKEESILADKPNAGVRRRTKRAKCEVKQTDDRISRAWAFTMTMIERS